MIGALFKSLINQIQSTLLQARAVSSVADDSLCPLPSIWNLAVRERLRALPYPEPYLTTVAEQVTQAVMTWKHTLDSPNSLVLLGSPVDDTTAVLTAALTPEVAPELTQQMRILRPLPWVLRPGHPLEIKAQLVDALAKLKEAEDDDGEDDLDDLARRQRVVVLPPLDQCFLRCIGGWEGIEWLRDTASAQRNYFWLIPSNTWAWAFLSRVCQVEAYLDQTMHLPQLDRDALCDWLTPLAKSLAPVQDDSSSALGDISWSNFVDLSGGRLEVVRPLWLRSLRLHEPERPDQPQPLDDDEPLPVPLRQIQPSLPSLPDLEAADHYVLHALMLHGVMSRSHLALSLGQPESIIHVRVQMLRQAGVLRLTPEGLGIHPAHYPRLRSELATNNFITGDD